MRLRSGYALPTPQAAPKARSATTPASATPGSLLDADRGSRFDAYLHLYWAVGRSGDETQRLRLMLDEGGWLAFSSYGNANPTPDRLATLLSLASDARIIAADEIDGELVYFAA